MKKGYVHIYTGNGKGKTTAALGLTLRAAGAGMKSHVIQFMKGRPSSEHVSAEKCDGLISIEHFGSERFIAPGDTSALTEHKKEVDKAMDRVTELMMDSSIDVLVLDEVISAMTFGLVHEDDIMNIIDNKKDALELVLTGRGASGALIEKADLVTEMKEVKHYFACGVNARKGIED